MTYFNILIIVLLVLFNLLVLRLVWVILTSRNVTQLEAAITSFALICAAVGMTWTSVATIVERNELKAPVIKDLSL